MSFLCSRSALTDEFCADGAERLTEPAKQKVPAGDVGSNKETEGGRENQEQSRKTKSSKNNDVGDDTAAK